MERKVSTAVFALLLYFVRLDCRQRQLRIRFGVDDVDNKYPYVVNAMYGRYRACTGALLSPTWVLTAAHCWRHTTIKFGNMTKKSQSSSFRNISRRISHPSYKMVEIEHGKLIMINDIALFQVVAVPMSVFGEMSAVCHTTLIGRAVEYVGFGSTYSGENGDRYETFNKDRRRPLQIGEGVIIRCSMAFLQGPSVCIAPKCSNGHQKNLDGDSGGPLLMQGKIVGVLSAELEPPISVYTPISPYIEWIAHVMGRSWNSSKPE